MTKEQSCLLLSVTAVNIQPTRTGITIKPIGVKSGDILKALEGSSLWAEWKSTHGVNPILIRDQIDLSGFPLGGKSLERIKRHFIESLHIIAAKGLTAYL